MNAHFRIASLRLGLILAAASVVAVCRPAVAAAPAPVASLDIVPADAAFYSAMLRNREQFEALANSNAWAKIKALPMYQMGMTLYRMQAGNPESPVGWLQAAMENPESRKSLEFLADLLSDEVFVYGGPSINKTVELYQGVYSAVQLAPLGAWRSKPGGPLLPIQWRCKRARAAPPSRRCWPGWMRSRRPIL